MKLSVYYIRVSTYVPSFILRSWKRLGAKDLNGCSPGNIEGGGGGERERDSGGGEVKVYVGEGGGKVERNVDVEYTCLSGEEVKINLNMKIKMR